MVDFEIITEKVITAIKLDCGSPWISIAQFIEKQNSSKANWFGIIARFASLKCQKAIEQCEEEVPRYRRSFNRCPYSPSGGALSHCHYHRPEAESGWNAKRSAFISCWLAPSFSRVVHLATKMGAFPRRPMRDDETVWTFYRSTPYKKEEHLSSYLWLHFVAAPTGISSLLINGPRQNETRELCLTFDSEISFPKCLIDHKANRMIVGNEAEGKTHAVHYQMTKWSRCFTLTVSWLTTNHTTWNSIEKQVEVL